MSNIYLKQMQRLGLNTKQYAELIEIPHNVVKDFIYEKDGEYEVGLQDLLRRNMLQKHQEIENNFEEAKLRASEIKYANDNVKYRDWYENDYSVELLLNTLHLKTRAEFDRSYDIMINGKVASRWVSYCMMSKLNYDNHEVSRDIQDQYIKQLYDIIVNGNANEYKRKGYIKVSNEKSKRPPKKANEYKNKYFKWFTDFDIKDFMKRHNFRNDDLARELNVGACTISYLINKRHYTKRTLQKLYDYVKNIEGINVVEDKEIEEVVENKVENEILDSTEEAYNELTSKKMDDCRDEVDVECGNNDILRRILANRLTDEEKELIRIFGGKI